MPALNVLMHLYRRGALSRRTAAILLATVAVLLAAGPAGAQEHAALRASLSRLIQHGGVAVADDGNVVFRYGPGRYVPASILKLATAGAALALLGPDYRFRTEVYRQGDTLYVRGYGDPLLVSEEWARIARALAERGVFDAPLGDVVLDGSAFAPNLEVDGMGDSLNPYDAPLGALVANFNTVFVAVAAGGTVTSAEPQTPLTPIARRVGGTLPPGRHRVNLAARGIRGIDYAGELARAVFEQAGARFSGVVREGKVPEGLRPLLIHRNSRPLTEVVRAMMEFSNNFIANQLVLALALDGAGEPARIEPGMVRVRSWLRDTVGLPREDFTLVEGSGLSRRNRIRLGAMLRVVDAFYPWHDLLKPYEYGERQVPAKTGTLTGVYTLAGYLPAPAGVHRSFVIMLNQPRHVRGRVFGQVAAAFDGDRTAAR